MSAQSGQRGEKRETWVSRHYDLRTEVWRGCTPKVSEFEGCSEPSPVRFVGGGAHPRTDLEGGSVPYILSPPSHTVYMVWFLVHLVE